MVYIDLSVYCIVSAEEFYADKLEAFDREAGRLICNLGVELIIDLVEQGTDRHIERFGQKDHAVSSFWIHVGGDGDGEQISILESLKQKDVEYSEVINLGGHYLKFNDPSGNKFMIHAHNGVLK